MNIETINEVISANRYIGHEKKNKMVEGDILVPDIKPDILSLIDVDSDAYITKYSLMSDRVEVKGIVEVNALYMAEENGGTIKSLNNVFEFEEVFNIEGAKEDSLVNIQIHKGPIEYKIVNARKLNVKSSTILEVKAHNLEEKSLVRDMTDSRDVELQKKQFSVKTLFGCKMEDIEVKENISLDEDMEPIGEILRASIRIINEGYKISYNKILAKADLIAKIIYVADNESNSIESFETNIPIMSFIDFDGINENMEIKLEYMIKSFLLRPVYQDMKSTTFSVESNIEVKTCAYRNENIEIVTDIYNPDVELNCEYEDIEVIDQFINHNEDIELIQGLLIPDIENIKILDIKAIPNITNQNVLDEKIAIEGNIKFEILYYNENKKILENKKIELPIAQVVKVSNVRSNMSPDMKINIQSIEHKKVDNSQIQIKIIMKVEVCSKKNESIRGVKSINVSEAETVKMPSIVIYYVKPHDTLWNIAKRFKTTVKGIMEFNNLKDDRIYPDQQLLIPRRKQKAAVEIL